jgi:hypothetical protein
VELHEIALNPLLPKRAGCGFGPIDQAEPCDRTSSGDWRSVLAVNAGPGACINDPTAKHRLDEGQDTPVKSGAITLAGFGTRCTTHLAAIAAVAPARQHPTINNNNNNNKADTRAVLRRLGAPLITRRTAPHECFISVR